MSEQLELRVANRATEIARAQDCLEQFAASHGIRGRPLHETQVALEEHLANIVNHGPQDGAEHPILIEFRFSPPELSIRVQDDGPAFNPLQHPVPDLTQPIEQRPIGGLGIHMMRKSMDAIEYRRENGHNILVMTKRT